MTDATPSQRSYAANLLDRCGYGGRVTQAWRPLLRKLDLDLGIGQDAGAWLATLTIPEASRLIAALKEEA